MKKFSSCFPVCLILFLSGCGHIDRSAPKYSAPSVAPATANISSAASHAGQAKHAIAAAAAAAPGNAAIQLQLQAANHEIDALTADLMDAQKNLASLQKETSGQTDLLNGAVKTKNVALARADKLDAQRRSAVSQRNKLLMIIGLELIWILRTPILALIKLIIPFLGGI